MKALTLIALCLVGCCSAYLIKVPTAITPTQSRISPLGWVHVQKLLLPLFDNVCEESSNLEIIQLAKDFMLDTFNGDYTKADVIENLRILKTGKGLLSKGEIFTEYKVDHLNELKTLYEVFFYARDFNTFYRAAAWARQNVNCGLFVDAIYLAIINRKDMAKVSVPAPYELLPNYFINKDVVVKASLLLTADEVSPTTQTDVRVEGNSYILDTNYTVELDSLDEDSKLAYFREDIGLNAYYFIRKLRNAPWLNMPNDVNSLYGERMYMMMKQFAARYDLERYSHGLSELEGFNWESTVPYDPMLVYSNGNEFAHRTVSSMISDSEELAFIKTLENNIISVATHLKQTGHTKSQILSHLMEILVTSDKSYETLCRKLLGYDSDVTERHGSVLDHYMTTLRDPIFWRVNKKIVQLINDALKILPSYTRNELYFPGVEVLNIETKKMMTNFDNFQFDVTDSLKTSIANTTFQVKIAQPRLNNKPFTMKLNVSSLVYTKGFVKIFIGPKMMPGELTLKKHLFVLLDSFEVSLKRGFNVITRSSDEMTSFSSDLTSLRALRKKVEDTEFGLDALPLKTVETQIGYPSRLVLPRGLPGGLPIQVLVFVAPLTKRTLPGSSSLPTMEVNQAILSPGYPLDLPIEIRQLIGLPNSLVREFTVTHKNEATGNSGRPGAGSRPPVGGRPMNGGRPEANSCNFDNTYDNPHTEFALNEINDNSDDHFVADDLYDDPFLVRGLLGDRPEFTYRKTDATNYAGNQNQFRKKEDYSSKRMDKSQYASKKDYSSQVKNEFNAIPVTTEPSNIQVDILPGDDMLNDDPNLNLKIGNKDSRINTNKKNNVFQRKDQTYFVTDKSVVEDDVLYYDLLVPRRILSNIINEHVLSDETDIKVKKPDWEKKEEDRTNKREQKQEKILIRAEEQKKEAIEKGEKKKTESIAKKEKKIDDNLAKREKVLKDLVKKGLSKKNSEERFDDSISLEKSDESMPPLFTFKASDELIVKNIDVVPFKYVLDYDATPTDDYLPQNLLGKSSKTNKKDTTEYNTKLHESKKNVNDLNDLFDANIKVNKNPLKHENIERNLVQQSRDLLTDDLTKSKATNSKNIDVTINNDRLNQNSFVDELLTTNNTVNKQIIKNIDKVTNPSKKSDEISGITKDITKVLDSKQVSKDIVDHQVNKSKVTRKDITKKIPVMTTNRSDMEDESKAEVELKNIEIYDSVLTTELPKKRVSVYDFLFKPSIYDDEEVKVYE